MYNWIDNNKNNNMGIMRRTASGVFTIRKGFEIRNRDSTRPSPYYYEDEPQYEDEPKEKWDPYAIQMCTASIQFDIISCNTSYHFKMSDLSTQVMDHSKEERSMVYNREKIISGALNDDSTEVSYLKDRLCYDSSKVPPNPPKVLYGLVPVLNVITEFYS